MAGLKRLKTETYRPWPILSQVLFSQFLRTEKNQFVTLLQVKKIDGNSKNAKAEWIWSDLFYWPNSELAE